MTAKQLLDRVQPLLKGLDLPAGYQWTVGGEVEASQKANGALFLYMPHCLVAIVVLLIWQFNSFRRTLIIILTIPLILIGASLGLNLSGAKLDFNAMLDSWPSRASSSITLSFSSSVSMKSDRRGGLLDRLFYRRLRHASGRS